MSARTRTASWILLALLGAVTLLGSIASIGVAYFSEEDQIGPVSLSELAGGRPDVVAALQARRGTAAAFAAAYSVLFLFIVLVPYRRGELWSYWALLAGILLSAGIILLRVPALGTHLGLGAATIPLGIGVVALLLDASRLRRS